MSLPVPAVLCSHPEAAARFRAACVLLDLSARRASFEAAVNAAQQSRIRNRQAANALGYFSRLPLAAKVFVRGAIVQGVPDLAETLHRLDTICADHATLWSAVTKRWQSGVYVKLPVSAAIIAVERAALPPAPDEALHQAMARRRREKLAES